MHDVIAAFWTFLGTYVLIGAVLACLYIKQLRMIIDLYWPAIAFSLDEVHGNEDQVRLKCAVAYFVIFILAWPKISHDLEQLK